MLIILVVQYKICFGAQFKTRLYFRNSSLLLLAILMTLLPTIAILAVSVGSVISVVMSEVLMCMVVSLLSVDIKLVSDVSVLTSVVISLV